MMKRIGLLTLVGLLAALTVAAAEKRGPASFVEKKFTVNFKNTPIREALDLIVRQAGMTLESDSDLKGSVSYAFTNVTLMEALNTLARDNQIAYDVKGNIISITQGTSAATEASGPVGDFRFRDIKIQYAKATDLLSTIATQLKKEESIVANASSNSLIFYGSTKSFNRIKDLVSLYDQKPLQILIEAEIVETTANFARDIGIQLGDLQAVGSVIPTLTGSISGPGPSNPNFQAAYSMGTTADGRLMQAKIQAAESVGDAKVVSRPRVYTLNNQKAAIHSGITYNVKTLSAISNGTGGATAGGGSSGGTSGSSGTNVAGGIQQISSGLELEVTPTIMGGDMVRLAIKVVKSEPDEGSAVDGIPGIVDNSADSTLIVKSGTMATLAGLLKNSVSKSNNRVPFLGSIPIIGWLFSSHSDRDRATELVILITPHIMNIGEQKTTANAAGSVAGTGAGAVGAVGAQQAVAPSSSSGQPVSGAVNPTAPQTSTQASEAPNGGANSTSP
jgi:type IV pilus assembly protein PilQ